MFDNSGRLGSGQGDKNVFFKNTIMGHPIPEEVPTLWVSI